ncbi:serine/threonine-protein kinase [Paenibacillus sp. F411]|uniref:serine/threonine-protein kinase n=1 Tax=Paenibacillus sp. F411 TaxID=2820239 RepID=UPI001FBA3A73|nr:serine/threonine-protein kinase [Paenibacillus sp. F411]
MLKQPSKLRPGSVLGERYEILTRIGEGGMGYVYLADDAKLPGKQWAVKESLHAEGQAGHVQAEADVLIGLNHPMLPGIIDFFKPDPDGYAYLIMDYIHGQTLEQFIRGEGGQVSNSFIFAAANQLLEVLGYLHQQTPAIIYRDLKPSNIMLTPDHLIRLVDFGIARSYKGLQGEDTVKLGTIGFAAPEQYGGGESDERSDLYGLGALLLYMLTNGRASEWRPGIKSFIREGAPPEMVSMVRRLLEQQPQDRYQSAAEVLRVLRESQHSGGGGSSSGRFSSFSGSLVTAVLGAAPGIGVTHCCIMMAHYLAKSFKRVAIVEMGLKSTAFKQIQEIAVDASRQHERKFVIQGIDYWRQAARSDIISLLAGSYDAVVLDLGAYRDSDRLEEFFRAQIPVVVCPSAEWRWKDVQAVTQALSRYSQPGRVYALPCSDEGEAERMSRKLGGSQVVPLPLLKDPFQYTDTTRQAMDQIYAAVIPAGIRRPWFSFAKRWMH